jgi:GT2 family glycosyltransferase
MSVRRQALDAAALRPIRVLEIDLGRPLSDLPGPSAEHPHDRALILARLHDEPLGGLTFAIPPQGVPRERLADLIWHDCGERIRSHLRSDTLPEPGALSPDGVPRSEELPPCRRERERFLAHAPPITVLIPSRERAERLRRCAESILASEYPSEKVTIVIADNAPRTEATRQLAQSLADVTPGRIAYVREDAPGSASARNRGLAEVDTEVVAMTDDDVIVDRHWLTEVARAFADHPAAGAVSGLLWPTELETAAQIWFEQYGGFSRGFERRVFDLEGNRPHDEPLYPWNAGLFGTGNNFSFRTAALREMGGFDPALGNGTPALGGVDSEMLLRTILSGHQIVYEPRAIAHHAHRADYEGLRRQVHAYGAGLIAYYLKTVLAEPRFAADFARKLPAGIRWMLSADSHINRHKRDDYPTELNWVERRGMLYGPVGYARSRRRYGRHPVYGQRQRVR